MAERMNYQSFPMEDRTWERPGKKAGTKVVSAWRGPPLRPVDMPTGPRLAWGSRSGASSSSKGIYFGNPGLPRFPYANPEVGPSLGPPCGLAKKQPPNVMSDWDKEMYSHLEGQPVSFPLEGVVGFNVTTAAHIRQLRDQLYQVENIYSKENRDLEANIAKNDNKCEQAFAELEKEELKIEAKQAEIAIKEKQLQALRELVEQNVKELSAARKQSMRSSLRAAAQARAAALGQ